jgi:heterotetrameric sarcosine oxidase delta subunit
MAIRIDCPHCGSRSVHEWIHGEIFDVPAAITDADARDIDRAYFHDNREGVVREAWFHLYGCRRWVVVSRDTTTDRIVGYSSS